MDVQGGYSKRFGTEIQNELLSRDESQVVTLYITLFMQRTLQTKL